MQKKKKNLRLQSFTAIGVKNNTWKLPGAKKIQLTFLLLLLLLLLF